LKDVNAEFIMLKKAADAEQ